MSVNQFCRSGLLIGNDGLEILKNSKVIVFGIGGVGSFVVEALGRTGIGSLVLVDNDVIDISNLNRQIHANQDTVGKVKAEAMKERILSINPECNVEAKQVFISAENINEILTEDIDYVVDAIDTVTSKLALAEYCYKNNIKIIASMGTGNKMDPSQFKVSDVFKTKVCPLAKVMRHELKKRAVKKLKVVYSEEMPLTPDKGDAVPSAKRQTPGSMSFVPPVAGMIIASQVVKDLIESK